MTFYFNFPQIVEIEINVSKKKPQIEPSLKETIRYEKIKKAVQLGSNQNYNI